MLLSFVHASSFSLLETWDLAIDALRFAFDLPYSYVYFYVVFNNYAEY